MAKKSIGIDNTRPPTNYIGAKTDANGNVIGIYQYNGITGVKIASNTEPITPEGDGTINAVTLDGETIQLYYSMSAHPGTVAIRTDRGTLIAATPTGDDSQELVTAEMLFWREDI